MGIQESAEAIGHRVCRAQMVTIGYVLNLGVRLAYTKCAERSRPRSTRGTPEEVQDSQMRPFDLVVTVPALVGGEPRFKLRKSQSRGRGEKQTMIGACASTRERFQQTMREAVLHYPAFTTSVFGANHHSKENVTMSRSKFRVESRHRNEAAVLQDQLRRNNVELSTARLRSPIHTTSAWKTAPASANWRRVRGGLPRTKPAVNSKVRLTAATSSIATRF